VLHYHPDYGPALYRGPSSTDLGNAAQIARATGRPATQFTEFDIPGQGRARTAFTVTPVPDKSVPGGLRMKIDLEFFNPTTGEYRHQPFEWRSEWSEYYHGRTTALDPDSAPYWHLMRSLGLSDEQIEAAAAAHRVRGAATPPTPEFLPPGGTRGRGNAIIGTDDEPGTVAPRRLRPPRPEDVAPAKLGQGLDEVVARRRAARIEREELRQLLSGAGERPTERHLNEVQAGLRVLREALPELGRLPPELIEHLARHPDPRGAARSFAILLHVHETGRPFTADTMPEGPRGWLRALRNQMAATRESHDMGVDFGTRRARADGMSVARWNNAESYIGEYGRGFDGVGREAALRYILEFKGGPGAERAPGQMTLRWTLERIARLRQMGDPMGDELLAAFRAGNLRGRIYKTVQRGDDYHTRIEETRTYRPTAQAERMHRRICQRLGIQP
jgi:hypothetical protein